MLTNYYFSLGQSQYSKVTAAVDEELNFAGYDELDDDDDTSPFVGKRQ